MFEGAAIRGTEFLLKMLKIFGLSLTLLSGGPNLEQQSALSDIPHSIPALESRLNLGIKTILYAVCPKCGFTHPPSYAVESNKPAYPKTCSARATTLADPCGAVVTQDDRPVKCFEYYPFFEWFGRFITLPNIESYGDRFCDNVVSAGVPPINKSEVSHGSFVYQFKGSDGRLFVAEEGRWLFLLHADFFNVEGNRIRGKSRSTGVMALTCLNLPLEIRNDPAYVYIPGIIQGPSEPNAKEAEHRHYLRPLVTDLKAAYTRGLQPFSRELQLCQFDSPKLANAFFVWHLLVLSWISKPHGPLQAFSMLLLTSFVFCAHVGIKCI